MKKGLFSAFVCLCCMLICIAAVALAEDGWTCPSCGADASGNFCNNCGAQKPQPVSGDEWTCPGCGSTVSGNFCNVCGKAKPVKDDLNINLGEMEIFKKDTVAGSNYTHSDQYDKYLKDTYNNEYEHSVSVGKGFLKYHVNQKFLSFKGVVACPKGKESDGFYRESTTLRIYGDDELLAEFKNFTDETEPVPFDINIAAYKMLTLEWKSKGNNAGHDWGYFATIFDGVLVPVT